MSGTSVVPGLNVVSGTVEHHQSLDQMEGYSVPGTDGLQERQTRVPSCLTRNRGAEEVGTATTGRSDLRITTDSGAEIWEVPPAASTRYLSHDYFRYIGKFPPQIPREFLTAYSEPGDLVLDPMCGGGTALIEARLIGRPCIGIDVNPVSVLVSTVTTRALPTNLIEEVVNFLEDLRCSLSAQQGLPLVARPARIGRRAVLPNMHGHEKYFDPETIGALEVFFGQLEVVNSPFVRDFLLIALLSELRSISYANVKKMNIELDLEKRTKKPLVYAVGKKIEHMIRINSELGQRFSEKDCEVREGEAAQTGLPDRSVGLAIVHPPYMTNTAFSEATQLQLAVLGISHKAIWRRELRARGSFIHEPDVTCPRCLVRGL